MNDSDRIKELEVEVASYKAMFKSITDRVVPGVIDSIDVVIGWKKENLRLSEEFGRCREALKKAESWMSFIRGDYDGVLTEQEAYKEYCEDKNLIKDCLTSLSKGMNR